MNALSQVHPHAAAARAAFHPDIVNEVAQAVASHRVVVVGMAWNPNCSRARRVLDERKIDHHYLEYGNYLSGWKRRLALKLWAGWPTFPMVFVNGTLVGGCSDMQALMANGEFDKLLATAR